MAINLTKGSSINLAKTNPGLTALRVGLFWEKNATPLDLDGSVFVCKTVNNEPKLFSDQHFVFYNNTSTPNGSVVHSGDNRSGDAAGDDEVIKINTALLEPEINEISFVVTIHEAIERNQSFGNLKEAGIRLYNDRTGELIADYDLDALFGGETAAQIGSLIKNANGEWEFKAVGAGYRLGLGDFLAGYQ